ncbi:MAG: lipopolysaccharide assembly LapA domain-containing protein [Dongiaceae bacterium]
MKRFAWIIAVIVLSVGTILLAVFNAATVEIRLGLWSGTMPAFAVILASLFVGVVIGTCIAWLAGHERRRRARDLANRNSALLRQIDELRRNQPANVIDASQPHRTKLVAGLL